MKTIVEPKEYIDKLWGKQAVKKQATYRLMKYVLRVDHDNKVILHNVVTGHMAVLDEPEVRALNILPASYDVAMEKLIEEHFLVHENYDEYKTVHQLRRIYQGRYTGNRINHYTILPTTYCNARCFYCYECDYPHVHMTEETASRIVDFIAEHRDGKDVSIQWFGGEPTVGMARIDQISQELKNRNIQYAASMISNGYLFDEYVVEKSVDLWKLQRIQITLDGTEKVYNRVKAYVGAKDNPYKRVLRNIDLLSNHKVKVNIRLNVDFYNKDEIEALIEDLGTRYAGNKNVGVYLNMLFNNQGFEPVVHSQDDIVELVEIIDGLTDRLKVLGLYRDSYQLPTLRFNQCMADNPHSLLIQPDGSFCRCEHESVNDSYGSVKNGVVDFDKVLKWREAVEHSDHCPECAIFPACYGLRYCFNNDAPCIESVRLRNLKTQQERIRSVYINNWEEHEDEEIRCT